MQETFEYIEAYFTQALGGEERKTFEARIVNDEAFAKEVAFYLTARSAAREALISQKQNTFTDVTRVERGNIKEAPVKKMAIRKWLPYAAAACVVFLIAAIFFLQSPSPQQMAANYIKDSYVEKRIGLTMDPSRDSMQLGIDAYNNKDYNRALELFEGVRRSHPEINDAKKYAGLAYLQTKNYDKALECFEELAAMKGLHSNSGDILSAATLLQRNNEGDKERAKALLQKVVHEGAEGSEEAKKWLEKWK